MNQSRNNTILTNEIIFVILGILSIIAIKMVYSQYRSEVNQVLLVINKTEIIPFALLGFDEAQLALETINNANPGTLDFKVITKIFAFVGSYLRWVNAGVLLIFCFIMWRVGIGSAYSRKLTMETLLKENADQYPGLFPVVDRKILDEPLHKGPWRIALQPLQFAIENRLLLTKNDKACDPDDVLDEKTKLPKLSSPMLATDAKNYLDRKQAEAVFIKQLGEKLSPNLFDDKRLQYKVIQKLPDYIQGLIAVFVAQGSGAQGRKKASQLLDQMSRSFQEEGRVIIKNKVFYKETITLAFKIDISGTKELIEKYGKDSALYNAVENHTAYLSTFLMSLYTYARTKGLLPSSLFLWLRPTNRTLWYTLNQMGGNTGWSESSGPWNHFWAEEVLHRTINIPVTLGAVDALEQALIETGWIPKSSDIEVEDA